jgi:hypothetical protein
MMRDMSHKTFLLTRASGAETNASQFSNLANMFAATAASKSTFTLLVTKEDGAIRDYLVLDDMAVLDNLHVTFVAPIRIDRTDHRWTVVMF